MSLLIHLLCHVATNTADAHHDRKWREEIRRVQGLGAPVANEDLLLFSRRALSSFGINIRGRVPVNEKTMLGQMYPPASFDRLFFVTYFHGSFCGAISLRR